MNLLYVGRFKTDEILSGPQKFAKRLFTEISTIHKVTFVSYFFEGALYSRWKKMFGYEIILLEGTSKVLRLGILPFIYFLLIKRFDIVHILNFERFAFLASKLKFIGGYKFVYTSHGLQRYEQPNFYPSIPKQLQKQDAVIEKSYFSMSDIVVFVSDSYKNFCFQLGCVPNKDAVIIHGVDEIFFEAPIKKKSEEELNILFVANVQRKEKGFDFFCETINQIKKKITVNIISDAKPTFEFNTNITVHHSRSLDPNNLINYWTKSDVIILCSLYEPFSITTIEAMASGIIPIVSSNVGMANLINDGENGIIFKSADSKKIVSWIESLSKDTNLLNEMKTKSRASVQSLRWDAVAKQYIHLYKSLL